MIYLRLRGSVIFILRNGHCFWYFAIRPTVIIVNISMFDPLRNGRKKKCVVKPALIVYATNDCS